MKWLIFRRHKDSRHPNDWKLFDEYINKTDALKALKELKAAPGQDQVFEMERGLTKKEQQGWQFLRHVIK